MPSRRTDQVRAVGQNFMPVRARFQPGGRTAAACQPDHLVPFAEVQVAFLVEHRAFGEVIGADDFDWLETALRQSADGNHGEGDRLHLDQDGR